MTTAMTAFLAGFWRFDGRLARLAYVLRCVVVIAFFLALLILAAEVFGLTPAETSGPLFFVEPIPNLVVALLFYWTIIAALTMLEVLENLVLPRMTDARLPEPLETMTPVGGILSILAYLWLLVWPSAKAHAPSSAPPDPSRRNGASPPPPA